MSRPPETTSELRERLRRLRSILTVAKGNTHAMEAEVENVERELARREALLKTR